MININMKMSHVVGSSLLKNHTSGTKKHKGGNKYKIGYQPNLSYNEYVKDIYEGRSSWVEDLRKLKLYDVDYFNWDVDGKEYQVAMSKKPKPETGLYTARVARKYLEDKLKNSGVEAPHIGSATGKTQGEARDNALEQVKQKTEQAYKNLQKVPSGPRSDNPRDYKGFSILFNTSFTREHLSTTKNTEWFKFENRGQYLALIVASEKFAQQWSHDDLTQLGFKSVKDRRSTRGKEEDWTEYYAYSPTVTEIEQFGLIPCARYWLMGIENDSDGNNMYMLKFLNRTYGPDDRMNLDHPSMTVACTPKKNVNEGLEDLPDVLFHVTFTKNVDNIKKKGLEQFHPSNWVKGPGGSRYNEDAGVFAFDNPEDAINWASKMRFDHKQTPISIVRLTIDPDNPIWDEDPAQDPIMRATLKGRALKSSQNINAERIVDAVDFTDLGTPGSHDMDRDEWIEKVAIPALNAR